MLSVHSTLFLANDSLKYFSQFETEEKRKKGKKRVRENEEEEEKKTMETITGDVLGF